MNLQCAVTLLHTKGESK